MYVQYTVWTHIMTHIYIKTTVGYHFEHNQRSTSASVKSV